MPIDSIMLSNWLLYFPHKFHKVKIRHFPLSVRSTYLILDSLRERHANLMSSRVQSSISANNLSTFGKDIG